MTFHYEIYTHFLSQPALIYLSIVVKNEETYLLTPSRVYEWSANVLIMTQNHLDAIKSA